jgi:hypothetical protein
MPEAAALILPGTVHIGGHKLVPGRLYTATANEGLLMFLPMCPGAGEDIAARGCRVR